MIGLCIISDIAIFSSPISKHSLYHIKNGNDGMVFGIKNVYWLVKKK